MLDNVDRLTEITGGRNRVFLLKEDSDLKRIEYRVLLSQKFDWQVKCYKCRLNGQTELFMLTDKYYRLSDILSSLNRVKVFTIVRQICESMIEVKSNGFLSADSILLDIDNIYYDAASGRVKLIYMPVDNGHEKVRKKVVDRVFELVESIAKSQNDDNYQLFISDILTQCIPSVELEDLVRALTEDNIRAIVERDNHDKNAAKKDRKLYLDAIYGSEPMTFVIEREYYVIGRSERFADGIIHNNRLVGRKHCIIEQLDGNYAIMDLNSINGTYLNGEKLNPHQEYSLQEGDTVGIANLKFRVRCNAEGL